MAKKITPGDAVKEKLAEFYLSVKELAEGLKLSEPTVRQIIGGNTKISLPVAFRLAKFFGGSAEDWFGIQTEYDLSIIKKDAGFQGVLKSIVKAKKPTAKEVAKKESEAKTKRGRPSKAKEDSSGASSTPKASKAGRPRKAKKDDTALDAAPKKARGRPSKAKKDEAAGSSAPKPARAGRPRTSKKDVIVSASSPKKVRIERKPRVKKSRVGETVEVVEPPKKPNSILIKRNRPKEKDVVAAPTEERDVIPLPPESLNIPTQEEVDLTPSFFLEDEGTQDQN